MRCVRCDGTGWIREIIDASQMWQGNFSESVVSEAYPCWCGGRPRRTAWDWLMQEEVES